ncbi:hypothetical protein BDA99DRAFT_22551 [Phascolomyces articulosus]|uniref:Uncharacterized protein n=1 Tax=Phascolomyces articulosus TaxID=60185 RepID=A0AAD5K2C5_9FUNG|nr:hypothetical protein BDA99DRAFT_22551 [Phascolomyces articulosus]
MANAQFITHYFTSVAFSLFSFYFYFFQFYFFLFTFFTFFFSLFHIIMAGGKVAARKRKRTNTGVQKENIITNGRRNTPLTLFQRQTEVNDSRDVNPEEVNSLQSLSSHSNVTSVPTPGDRPVSFSEETATPVSLLDHEPSPPAPSQPPLPRQQHPLLRSLETTYAVSEGNSFITAAPLSPVPPVVSEHTSEQLDFAANNLLNQTSNLIPLRYL